MFPDAGRLYPLTDTRLSNLSHAEQVLRFSEGGARVVQLREKHLSSGEFYDQAAVAVRVGRARNVTIIINDRVDVALAVGADGVHLGQDDLPPDAARWLLGNQAIIGFSTHNLEQAVEATRLPLDYIALGPIFGTSSKENPDPPVGLVGLAQVRQAMGKIPIVAIGGINRENARQVIEAGADAVAVISALLVPSAEIVTRTRQLLSRLSPI